MEGLERTNSKRGGVLRINGSNAIFWVFEINLETSRARREMERIDFAKPLGGLFTIILEITYRFGLVMMQSIKLRSMDRIRTH